jgi:cobalamin synthase
VDGLAIRRRASGSDIVLQVGVVVVVVVTVVVVVVIVAVVTVVTVVVVVVVIVVICFQLCKRRIERNNG